MFLSAEVSRILDYILTKLLPVRGMFSTVTHKIRDLKIYSNFRAQGTTHINEESRDQHVNERDRRRSARNNTSKVPIFS